MRLSQVAYMAGYTEPAALVRAFKRWTGATAHAVPRLGRPLADDLAFTLS